MKKENHLLTITWFLFSVSSGAQTTPPPPCNDFVKINGKYFNCDGELFYPLTTEYVFIVKHNNINPSGTDYYLSPSNFYGECHDYASCAYFEQQNEVDALAKIALDFETIHEMGFNCIRTAGLGPEFEYVPPLGFNETNNSIGPTSFIQRAQKHDVQNGWSGNCMVVSTDENTQDDNRDRMFTFIDQILELAHDASLKIILDVGYFYVTNDAGNNSQFDHFTKYKEYLKMLAEHVALLPPELKQTLIAYVVVEETQWAYQNGNKKSGICVKTNEMYDILKQYDPEHLVTLGGIEVRDIMEWDPAVMKLDFWSPHMYPNPARNYELNSDLAVNRLMVQLYWLKNNCSLPWIIGETGFSCIDDKYETNFTVQHYPKVNGEEEFAFNGEQYMQKNFATDMLKMVRDCGGAGFSMWQFQEVGWDNVNNATYDQDGYGLLKHGPTSPYSAVVKKATVDVFESYLNTNGKPPEADPAGVQIPNYYFDPYRTADFSSQFFPGQNIVPVTGMVEDQNGNPVKDAMVMARVFTGQFLDDLNPNAPHYPVDNIYYTFTNDNQTGANYSITPFESVTGDAQRQYIRWLEVSGTGKSKEQANNFGWDNGYPDYEVFYYQQLDYNYPPHISQSDFTLRSITTSIDREIQNEIINNTNSPASFAARLTLTASVNNEIQSGGVADFYALNEVHITDEFHAAAGSEVHIYNAPLFTDCNNDFPNPVFRLANQGGSVNHTATSSLELQFVMEGDELRIIPNPNTGIFFLKFSASKTTQWQLKCFDLMGKLIMSQQLTESTVQLNLSTAPKGMYYVQVSSENKTYSQKLIIQ